MKLTICNAHEFKLSKTGKSFIKGNWKNGTYFLFDQCAYCKEPYFSKTKNATFCSNQCNNNSQKYPYQYIKDYIEKEGYELLSDTYVKIHNHISVKCDKGHEYKVTFNNFYLGYRCPICNNDNKKHSYQYIKDYIEKEGYQLLSDTYVNAHNYIKVKCNKGHIFKTKFNWFESGRRCPICNAESTSSKQEQEVQDYVESLGYRIIRNDRTQIINPLTNRNLELDIWIPDKNKAIEYNGTYWHNKLYMVQKDKIKVDQCKQKGIDLLVINEDKWTNSKNIEQDIITKFLEGKL